MFPTFISILDIQSWWEVPSIAHFCSLFRTAFNLLDFDIEDLEEALLTDGTEETSWLQELIVRLLSGCLANNEISTFNYQMFLRRLFRQKCQEHDRYNPFNTDVDFQLLPLRTKVDILHALCDFRLDADDVLEQLKNLEADSLRVEPLGYDSNDSAYWYFYGTRLYREDFKTKNSKKKSVWQVICFTEDDWFQLDKKFKKSTSKNERQLHRTLTENFLPELPRLFREKERLARKRLLENQPRRTSSRLRKENEKEESQPPPVAVNQDKPIQEADEEDEKQKKRDLEIKRREAYERRTKLKEQSEDSEVSESRYEMAGAKTRQKKMKEKGRQRKSKSPPPKDDAPSKSSKGKKKSSEGLAKSSAPSSTTTVGRQTNNSLAAATGQIVIQPVSNPHKKKLKTSQVFRQTDEDLITGMHKILENVKNHEEAWPFAEAVDEDYAPNYYTVIRKPMDLQRMEDRLDSGFYKNYSKFRDDFQLIVDNCRLYNGAENEYTIMVDNLLKAFERATEKYLDQISSSDDEFAVEFPDSRASEPVKEKETKKPPPPPPPPPASTTQKSKRKPTLSAKTDKKRDRSLSDESRSSETYECSEDVKKATKKQEKLEKVSSKKQCKSSSSSRKIETKVREKSETKGRDKSDMKSREKSDMKSREKSDTKGRDKSDTKGREKSDMKGREKSDTKSREKSEAKVEGKSETKVKERKNSSSKVSGKKKEKKYSPFRKRSRTRSRSRSRTFSRSPPRRAYSSSPPPSDCPSTPPDNRFDFSPKKQSKEKSKGKDKSDKTKDKESGTRTKGKLKQQSKHKNLFDYDDDDDDDFKEDHHSFKKSEKDKEKSSVLASKPKDKHNKLRETIEKLKAKSEISNKLGNSDFFYKSSDVSKAEKVKSKDKPSKSKAQSNFSDFSNSPVDSPLSVEKKSSSKKPPSKKPDTIDALTIATEQTLKDINKWLDDTPKFSEFSSASNSPSYGLPDPSEFESVKDSSDQAANKKKPPGGVKKDKDQVKRRPPPFGRDPTKFLNKRREIQRTIDRLQPGKSKGNLISNVKPASHQASKADDFGPLAPLSSKAKDAKNSLIVKTDDNAPKLSLGSVLDSFGKHKFVEDDVKKKEEEPAVDEKKVVKKEEATATKEEEKPSVEPKPEEKCATTTSAAAEIDTTSSGMMSSATPNLSAWFKAFGAPKPAKKPESKSEEKGEDTKVPVPEASPEVSQPAPRQRKISTGSSVSERSSFSQDMDSPRVGIDERLGAYPAPYPSPLHRSPSGASPVMASPRPELSPKAPYPPFNGQIRVGFYQDTVSNKSSPDKSCSPRDNPQSPYVADSHVYTPNTTSNPNPTYPNSPYYSQNYNPSYTEAQPPAYYDTNKSLTDQYQQAKQYEEEPKEKSSSPMFPVKKRAYTDEYSRYEDDATAPPPAASQASPVPVTTVPLPAEAQQNPPMRSEYPPQPLEQQSGDEMKQYIQNIPDPKQQYPYNYGNESNYPLSIPSARSLGGAPSELSEQRKIDMSKYTNMGYTGPEVNFPRGIQGYAGPHPPPHSRPDMNFVMNPAPNSRTSNPLPASSTPQMQPQPNEYPNPPQYSAPPISQSSTQHYPSRSESTAVAAGNYESASVMTSRGYAMPSRDESGAALAGLTNLSHIVDYPSKEQQRKFLELQQRLPSSQYYGGDKGISGPPHPSAHMFNKPIVTSASGLPIFNQAMQSSYGNIGQQGAAAASMYNRQISELHNPMMGQQQQQQQQGQGDMKVQQQQQQQQQAAQPPQPEKKSKKRKSNKTAAQPAPAPAQAAPPSNNQGFQSYAGLKGAATAAPSMEPNAISLKTASVVPGSAFNFGPTPTGLGIGSGLYGDAKDAYPNFLEDFRTAAPSHYYTMAAAAAAHHRSTPDASGDKQARGAAAAAAVAAAAAHQGSAPQAPPSYPFIGAPQARTPGGYPLGGPFMPPAQAAQLMDPSSPLYQHYLQAGVLNQGLLGPPGPYPPGYHPLSMRQPYHDSMSRPSWLQ